MHLVRVGAASLFAGIAGVLAAAGSEAGNPGTPWPATDALGRRLPCPTKSARQARPFRRHLLLPLAQHPAASSPNWDGPYDVAKILAQDPDALQEARLAAVGPDRHVSTTGASRSTATTSAPIRGCCAATPNCWPTPASTR